MEKPAKSDASAFGSLSFSKMLAIIKRPTSVLMMTTGANILLRMVSSVVLTRLLPPSVFGMSGIIMSFFFTIVMLTDLGFQPFIVRHQRGNEPHFKNVIWTVQVTRGVLLTAVGVAAAPFIAQLLDKPTLATPLAVASLQLAFMGACSLSLMTALRSNGANKLSLLDLGLNFFQVVASIALAFWLRSIWAIVFAMLGQNLLRAILSYALFTGSGHRLSNDRNIRHEFFVFSRIIMVSSFVSLLLGQSDKLFLARAFSLEEFGLYTIAANLAMVPATFTTSYAQRILYPAFAKAWSINPKTMSSTYYGSRLKGSILFALGSGALIGGAPLLIRILYDPRYTGAALFLSVLAIGAALRFPNIAAREVLIAVGKVKATLYANIVRLAWLAVAGPIGYFLEGNWGVVLAVGTMEAPAMLFTWFMLAREKILNLRHEFIYISMVFGSALITASMFLALSSLFPSILK